MFNLKMRMKADVYVFSWIFCIGLPMVVANSDEIVLSPSGDVLYMPGTLAGEYMKLGGRTVIYGKPNRAVYEKVFDKTNVARIR